MKQGEKKLKIHMKLRVYVAEPSFGPGVSMLMREVDKLGSMSAACKKSGMAYSKAWKIVQRAEADLGLKLFHSTSGGRNGGGMELTAEGRKFLDSYENFEKKAREHLETMLEECFADYNADNSLKSTI